MNLELFKTDADGKFSLWWASQKCRKFCKTDAHGVDAILLTQKIILKEYSILCKPANGNL